MDKGEKKKKLKSKNYTGKQTSNALSIWVEKACVGGESEKTALKRR